MEFLVKVTQHGVAKVTVHQGFFYVNVRYEDNSLWYILLKTK